jgi:hypothetical protein
MNNIFLLNSYNILSLNYLANNATRKKTLNNLIDKKITRLAKLKINSNDLLAE